MSETVVDAVNSRLRSAGVRLRLRVKGNALYVRGQFPAKVGDGMSPKRYDHPLRLPASKDGLKRAERLINVMAEALTNGSFCWSHYIDDRHSSEAKPIAQLVEEFKAEYFRTRKGKKRQLTEETWANTWAGTFNKLPQDIPINEALVLAVVCSTPEGSRNRELACQRLQRLVEFAGLEMDLSIYRGDYEPEPRDIPSDELIIEWRDRVPNEAWQWVYGMVATFGLRPHEVFACDFIDPLTLKVHQGTKTGTRTTRAILPEWAERWNLIDVKMPNVKVRGRQCGQLVSRQFGVDRYNLPMRPYDLRHAWAIRASVAKGLPVSVSAKMMGHSVATHTRVYHKWLSDAEAERVYRSLILGQG